MENSVRTLCNDLTLQQLDLLVSRHAVELRAELRERLCNPRRELVPTYTHLLQSVRRHLLHPLLQGVELVRVRDIGSRVRGWLRLIRR